MAGVLGTIVGQVRLDIRQAVAAYAAVRAQNARTVYALRGAGDSFVQSGDRMATAGAALIYVFGKSVQAAAEFEKKMDFFAAVSNTSADSMKKLSTFTLQLAENTKYSASEIADGFIELGKAGVKAEQIIGGIGKAMADLGAAGDIPLAQSGQIITSTIQQFDLAATDAVRVVDLLAGAANASIADISDIGVSLKYVGGVANAAGLEFEDTATAISLLAKAGIRGSTAGTSLRQMIVSLNGSTGPARKALQELGIITEDGSNKFYTQEGKVKPLAQVYQVLQNATKGLTAQQRLAYLRTIFNNRALSAAAILTREGAKGFEDMNAEMRKTTAADVAAKRMDNLAGDIEILKGNIETLLTKAGGPFQEMLRGWVQNLTDLVQAFDNLSPGTQKAIMQTIALTGVFLLVGGVVLRVVGMFLRMLAGAKKLWAGLKFLWGAVKALLWVFGLITGGAISATFLAIAAAVLAVIGVFVLAYYKIEAFRNMVNSLAGMAVDTFVAPFVDGLKKIIAWFKLLATNPKQALQQLVNGMGNIVTDIVGKFSGIGDKIGAAIGTGGGAVKGFIDRMVGFFTSLPGRVLGVVSGFVGRVTSLFSFSKIGAAIGGLGPKIITFFLTLGPRIITAALRAVTGVINVFARLAPRVGYFVGFMLGRVVGLLIRLAGRMIALGARAVNGLIKFFQKLPGRVATFMGVMVTRGIAALVRFAQAAVRAGPRIVNGLINAIKSLPGKVGALFVRVISAVTRAVPRIVSAARRMATGAYNGLVGGIQGIPGAVSGVIGRMISAFTGAIGRAYSAAKAAASSMWQGFKDGIGMNSPSYFERAMWQITGTVAEESKKLGAQTLGVQKMSKKVAATKFAVYTTQNIDTITSTRRVGDALGAVAATSGSSGSMRVSNADELNSKPLKVVGGKLQLVDGEAYIYDVAVGAVNDDKTHEATDGRRRKKVKLG